MVPIELEFQKTGELLLARFECQGEPAMLTTGKRGWFAVSRHIPWRFGWELKVHCPITVPGRDYGYPRPASGTSVFAFEPKYCGTITIEDRALTLAFRVPDCLDPPKKKSFNWGKPILLNGQMFHCAARLETRAPKDGSYMRRRPGDAERASGIEFVVPQGDQVAVIGYIQDSAHGRILAEREAAEFRDLLDKIRTRK
jgi:hypothetical protein